MRFLNSYWILILCSLFIFSGTAGAHPHKLGKMSHGPSLESYQVDPDFSIGQLLKDWLDPKIMYANKNKSDKSVRGKNPHKNKINVKGKQTKKQQKETKK